MADTFKGYATDLLMKVKHMGRAIVADDALYSAAQEYTDPSRGGGLLGPAITTSTPAISVTPPKAKSDTPAAIAIPVSADPEAEADPWAAYDLLELRDLMHKNNVTVPRALSYGKAIAALEAAGVRP